MKTSKILIVVIFLLIIWNIALTTTISNNKNNEAVNYNQVIVSGFSTDLTDVVANVNSSVVTISTDTNIFSGFIYQKDSDYIYIVSTSHGINGNKAEVTFDSGLSVMGEISGIDYYSDLVLIKVKSNLEVVPVVLGESQLVKEGEFTLVVGTPGVSEYKNSIQLSMISSSNRNLVNKIEVNGKVTSFYGNYLQLSSDLSSGYSGAPIFNMNGEVIGVVSMKNKGESFGLRVNEIKLVIDKMIAGEKVNKLNLGIKYSSISEMPSYTKNNLGISIDTISGIYIESILNDSKVVNSLRSGDIIVSINGTIINDEQDYLNVLYQEATILSFDIIRNGSEILVECNLND